MLVAALVAAGGCDNRQIVALSCGDGRVDAPESCDDGELNGTPGHCRADCSGVPALASIEGDVLPFGGDVTSERLSGVRVTILELPNRSTSTAADGHFQLDDVEAGSAVTLVAEADGLTTTQSATVRLGEAGIQPFVLHAMPRDSFVALGLVLEPERCTVVVAASRIGDVAYTQLRLRAAGVTMSLEPAADVAELVYLDEDGQMDPELAATTASGLAVFRGVPPGGYEIVASQGGRRFSRTTLQCRAGALIVADAPFGPIADVSLPEVDGAERPPDAYSAATDALCEQTAQCVEDYPDDAVASCQAAYDNIWSDVSPNCDTDRALRDAIKALVDCYASSCENALAAADPCPEQTAAFDVAVVDYGACVGGG